MTSSPDCDRVLARLAARQQHVVTHWQLRGLGLSEEAITYRVHAGRLHRIHHGVYAVGRRALTALGNRLAAVLACGPQAVLSHTSATEHWGLLQTAQARFDVTVPGTSRASRTRIYVHRARRLHPEDVQRLDGVPVTSVARTLLDLAALLSPHRLLRALEQAARTGKLDVAAVRRVLERNRGRRGVPKLRRLLDDFDEAPATRSELERNFLELVDTARLPRPQLNVHVAGFLVDAYWPQWRLVVELDSRAFHADPRTFETDRVRDAVLQRAQQRVLRVTDRRMRLGPKDVVEDVCALAALATGDPMPRPPRPRPPA